MRQAGRYMSEYRALRERYSLLDLCRTPDLATEVTLQPVRRIEVDAAILFSDLLLPLEPMGIPFDFVKGEGPAIEQPAPLAKPTSRALKRFEPRESAVATCSTPSARSSGELGGRVPLIGFAGAPFTLASYAIEGGHSNNFAHTKALMYGASRRVASASATCSPTIVGDYLVAQIEAGVEAVQVFDSWVGALNARDYREFILPHTKKIFDRVAATGVPTIHFGVGTGSILDELREAGGDVIGADWRTPLDEAWERIGDDRGDPGQPRSDAAARAAGSRCSRRPTTSSRARADGRATSSTSATASCPSTPVEHVQALARYVHQTEA